MATGKLFVFATVGGKMVATLYTFDMDGTSFLAGYVTVSADADAQQIAGQTDPERSASDFFGRALSEAPGAERPARGGSTGAGAGATTKASGSP